MIAIRNSGSNGGYIVSLMTSSNSLQGCGALLRVHLALDRVINQINSYSISVPIPILSTILIQSSLML